jgi:hypothetical protein
VCEVGVFPDVPRQPVAARVKGEPTQLHVVTYANRSNGAEVVEYDVWRQRVRGGVDENASDSDADPRLPEDENDSGFVSCIGAIPDEFTVRQRHKTSGHSGDKLRILVEGLKPGTFHRFKLRAKNTYGFSDWTLTSNVCQTERKQLWIAVHALYYSRVTCPYGSS